MEDESQACEPSQEGKAHDQETQTTFDVNGSVLNHQPPPMHPPMSNTDRGNDHPGFSSVTWSARYSCQPPSYPDNYYPYEAGYPTPTPPPHHHGPYYQGRNPHWHHPDGGVVYPPNHTTPVQVAPMRPNEYPRRNYYPPSPADGPPQRPTEIARPKPEWPSRAYYQFPKPNIPAHFLAMHGSAHRNVHSEYGGPPSTATSLRSTVLDVTGSSISSPRASAHIPSRKRPISSTPSIESIDLNMLIRNSPDSLLGCLAGSRISSAGSFGHLSPIGFCTASTYNHSGSAAMQTGRPPPFITPPPIQPVNPTKMQEQPRDVFPSSTTDIPKEEATAESMSCAESPPMGKTVHGPSNMKEETMESCKLDSTTSPGASEIPVGSDNEADEGQGEVEEPNLTCHWRDCTTTFDNQADLVNHVNGDHIKKEKRDFTCYWQDCCREQKPFKAQYMLVVHMRRHTGEKPHICKYEGCSKAYSRLENLKTHLRSHTGERPYVCEVEGCSKAFSNASDRAKHQNRTHSSVKPYVCKVPGCPKRYTDPSSLRKHTKTVHGDQGVKRLKSDTGKDKETQSPTKKPTSNQSNQPSSNANTTSTMVQSPSSDVKSPGSGSGSGSGTIKKAGGYSSSVMSNSCNTDFVSSSTCDVGSPSVDIPGSHEGCLGVSQPAPSGLSPRSPAYISHLPDIAEGDWEPGSNESAVTTVQPCERPSQAVTLPKIHNKTHDIASWVSEVYRRMSQTSTRRSSESSHLSVDLTGDGSRRSSESGWASNNGSRRSSQTSLNPQVVPHPPNTQVSPGNKAIQGSLPRANKTLLPVNDGDLRRASETSNTSSQSQTFTRHSHSSSGYGSQSNLAIIRSPMFHRIPYPLQKQPYHHIINGRDRPFRRLSDTVVCEADSSEMSRKRDGGKEEYRRRSEPAQNLRSNVRHDPMTQLSSSFPTNEAEPRETELINDVVDPREFDAYLSPEQLQPTARQTQPLRHFPYTPDDVYLQPQHPVESQTIHYRPNHLSARTSLANPYYPPPNNSSPTPSRLQFQRYHSQYPSQEQQLYPKQTRLQSFPQGQMITQYQQRPPPVMGYYEGVPGQQPEPLGTTSSGNYEAMLNSMEGLSTNGGPDMSIFGLGNGNMVINDMNTLLNSLLEEEKYLEMQQNSHRMAGSSMSSLF